MSESKPEVVVQPKVENVKTKVEDVKAEAEKLEEVKSKPTLNDLLRASRKISENITRKLNKDQV